MDAEEVERRTAAGMRFALALVTAHVRCDDAAVELLLSEAPPELTRDALQCATSLAAVSMATEARLLEIPEAQLLEFLSSRIMGLAN